MHKIGCSEETRLVLRIPSSSRSGKRFDYYCCYYTGGSGFGSQSMRSSGGSGVGRFSHGHTSSAGSTADWGSGSGNWSPSSAGQPLVIVPCSENLHLLLLAVSLGQLAAVGSGNVFVYSLLLLLHCCHVYFKPVV